MKKEMGGAMAVPRFQLLFLSQALTACFINLKKLGVHEVELVLADPTKHWPSKDPT